MTSDKARRHDARTSAASEGSRSGRHQLGWKRRRLPDKRPLRHHGDTTKRRAIPWPIPGNPSIHQVSCLVSLATACRAAHATRPPLATARAHATEAQSDQRLSPDAPRGLTNKLPRGGVNGTAASGGRWISLVSCGGLMGLD